MAANTMQRRIRSARLERGLSARGLDELAGLTQGHTWLIENGKRPSPSAETVRRLAVALGCSFEWLLTGATKAA